MEIEFIIDHKPEYTNRVIKAGSKGIFLKDYARQLIDQGVAKEVVNVPVVDVIKKMNKNRK
jgi:hypothetical protein